MKQIPSDKYNVAWFTLAECVSRGEKVRAISLYRLLAHSIKDNAFTSQLKGDLLLAFRDDSAVDLYEEAAELYIKDNRQLEAAGVFEHLHILNRSNCRYIRSLIKLYHVLRIESKVAIYILKLFEALHENNNFEHAYDSIAQLEQACSFGCGTVQRKFILHLLQKKAKMSDVLELGKKLIESFYLDGLHEKLQEFLSEIEKINEDYYLIIFEHFEFLKDKKNDSL